MLRTPKRSLSQKQVNSFKQGCLYSLLKVVNRIKLILCNEQEINNIAQGLLSVSFRVKKLETANITTNFKDLPQLLSFVYFYLNFTLTM